MKEYQNFMGIDIGKCNFVVALLDKKTTAEYENSAGGIREFLKDYRSILSNTLIVLETTGGYELRLLYTLCDRKLNVHRADTRKVKNFIRSLGSDAKTDALDAKALANYGKERFEKLDLFKPQSKESITLFQLIQRRNDLKQMLVAEKNRTRESHDTAVKRSIQKIKKELEKQLEIVTNQIMEIIDSNPTMKKKLEVLKSIPGVGDIVAFELLILLPELGQLSRRKIASLAGVAPKAKDSGTHKGYRRTSKGREGIKPVLFISAMAARNSKSSYKEFYENLTNKGKKKMVALTALMRKIVVVANAKIRDLEKEDKSICAIA